MFPMRDVESCEGREPRAIAFERHERGIFRNQLSDSKGEYMSYLTPFTANGGSVLPPRNVMSAGQFLQSPNKRFRLIYQPDENLALYDGDKTVWVADSNSAYATQLIYKWQAVTAPQVFMNYSLVLNDFSRQRIWQTTNSDVSGGDKNFDNVAVRTHLQVQDDGNMVIVESAPLWTTSGLPLLYGQPSYIFPPGTYLEPGKIYTVGSYGVVFQGDGNLVVYGPGSSVVWASYTQGKGGTTCVMQGDGNLVIYNAAGVALWHTHTAGNPDAVLSLQLNGRFTITQPRPVWARFGYTPSIRARKVYYPDNSDPLTHSTKPFPTQIGTIGYEF